jgi:hypothetical protein
VSFKTDNIILIFLVLVLCQCSGDIPNQIPTHILEIENLQIYPKEYNPSHKISFDQQIRYASTDDHPIGMLAGFSVDDFGRIYISDYHQRTIFVFEADGNYITKIGREGSGPGEFRVAPIPYVVSNQLYVVELMPLMLNIFSIDSFKINQTLNISPLNKTNFSELDDAYITRIFPGHKDNFLVSFAQFNRTPPTVAGEKIDQFYLRYYLMNVSDRMLSNQVFKLEQQPYYSGRVNGRIQTVSAHFLRKPLVAVSDKGYIFSANSDNFLIRMYDPKGNYVQAFYYPFDNVKLIREQAVEVEFAESKKMVVEEELREEIVEDRIKVIEQNELPASWPALNDLLVDDENRLWVSTIVEDFDVYQWWVLEETGELITKFEWSRDKPIKLVRNSCIYTRETDEETGLQQIVRYRIELEEV